jgi:hypothetical protein
VGAELTGDYDSILRAVEELPRAEQIDILFHLLNTLLPEGGVGGSRTEALGRVPERHVTRRARKQSLQRALGLLATDKPAPTDAEVEQWLEEYRQEKYGQ